ncbi:FG-GAP repeat domain-containing protein [Tahibacter harae]|uniref:VCBS repeat-containing protein n=1 Tax=Tahibacter harae TaxID=2963937 RepID=A0ABT1QQ86_9GAMM|nr:VCBS repeat-containing protein [Tahibacter harae]MCQ4164464.1 VCBS repeat-containing protein [Tahibacter harae]
MSYRLGRRLLPCILLLLTAAPVSAAAPFELIGVHQLPTPPDDDAGPVSLLAGDFTRDGRADIVVSFGGVPVVVFAAAAPGYGGFQPKPQSALSRYDSGYIDRLLLASAAAPAGAPREIVYADTTHSARRLQWLGGTANYAPTADRFELLPYQGAVGVLAALAAGDFNGDGRNDIALVDVPAQGGADGRSNGVIAWGRVGTAQSERSLPAVANPYFVASADFTGDAAHLPDLLIASRQRDVGLTSWDAAAQQLVLKQTLSLDATAIDGIAAGDLNGDGRPDALVQLRKAGQTSWVVIENRGGQGLALGATAPLAAALTQCIGDFDADGVADVLLDGDLLYFGESGYRYTASPRVINALTYGLACADFDGDGRLDFATATYAAADSTLELRIYRYRDGWDRIFANGFN